MFFSKIAALFVNPYIVEAELVNQYQLASAIVAPVEPVLLADSIENDNSETIDKELTDEIIDNGIHVTKSYKNNSASWYGSAILMIQGNSIHITSSRNEVISGDEVFCNNSQF